MSNLRLLKFYMPKPNDVQIISSKVHLDQGLEYFPEDMKYLHWHGYPLKTLPFDVELENLVELNLPYSKIEQIWEGKKKAFKLKSIDLGHSQYLTRMPDLSETPNLERINFLNCTNLACVPSSIQNFNHLTELCFRGCKSLRSFPSNLHFVCPISIDFSSCVNLTEFPQISGNIKTLYLFETAIEEVPSSIECLTNLTLLTISRCTRLKRVSTSICKLKSLIWLSVHGCLNLESFPESLEKMEHLNQINLGRAKITEQRPSSFENVEGLGTQGLEGCSEPDNIGNLKSHEYVGAHGSATSQLPPLLSGLGSLPASLLSGLSSLNWLDLDKCGLMAIPQEIGCLSSLEWLHLSGNNFESLPASIKQLSRLRELFLSDCNMLQSLPELPPSLELLDASNCQRLQSLPEIPSCLEELDASLLEKLSKHSRNEVEFHFSRHQITSSSEFWLINCSKLAEEANRNLADSQLRIQHMAIASLRRLYDLEMERGRLGGPSIILPGSEIPEWFSNQSSGSLLTLQMPRHCRQTLVGFAFCAVLVSCDSERSGFDVDFRYSFETKTLGGRKRGRRCCFEEGWVGGYQVTKTDHVVLGFSPCGKVGFPDDNHHTTVSFEFLSRVDKVKCYGVCPVYANPNETKPNTFTLNFATQVWKLDDMASASGTSDEEELELSPKRICRDDEVDTP
ncbi:hypothetical protein WN944_015863 [Citrus x changshan-huyou]|uniref:C-JID domain-containing protein n=1 Tax=Citrus x changshan-huyou TaxID=2935761 RepID=A0AAP0MD98_9ROSI